MIACVSQVHIKMCFPKGVRHRSKLLVSEEVLSCYPLLPC